MLAHHKGLFQGSVTFPEMEKDMGSATGNNFEKQGTSPTDLHKCTQEKFSMAI